MSDKYSVRQLPNSSNTMFSTAGIGRMKKAYCSCGRIIGFDSNQMNLKLSLGKDLECPICRTKRIAKEITEMNICYGAEPEESF